MIYPEGASLFVSARVSFCWILDIHNHDPDDLKKKKNFQFPVSFFCFHISQTVGNINFMKETKMRNL